MNCPHCGKPLEVVYRLGVQLTPIKVRIFDVIRRAGEGGVSAEVLSQLIFHHPDAKAAIKSHVWQINERIEDTGWKIVPTNPRYGYRLKQRTENRK
jgi:hypothetical protein